jgi:hypothetical protein
LLTVLLHEIGHVVGFDHDAASAVPAIQEVFEAVPAHRLSPTMAPAFGNLIQITRLRCGFRGR